MTEKKFEGIHSQYVCLETNKLGSGGQGSVYKVECMKTHSHYALKVFEFAFDPNQEDKKQLAKREIELLTQLNSTAVPQIIDQAKKDEEYFYVMDYIDGESLRKKLENKTTFTETTVLDYIKNITTILNTLHNQDIAHRDIKPENIIITNENDIKLVDFGISKNVAQSTTTETNRGTAIYKPQGYPAKTKEDFYQDDIYSLGVTMYELFHGIPPWNPLQGTFPEVNASSFRKDISSKGKKICLKMLKINRQLRYKNTQEILEDIDKESVFLPSLISDYIIPNNKMLQYSVLALTTAILALTGGLIYFSIIPKDHPKTHTHTGIQYDLKKQYINDFSSIEEGNITAKISKFKELKFDNKIWIDAHKTYKSNLILEIKASQKKNKTYHTEENKLNLLLKTSVEKVKNKFLEEIQYMSQDNYELYDEKMNSSSKLMDLLIEELASLDNQKIKYDIDKNRIIELYTIGIHNFITSKTPSSKQYENAKKYCETALPILGAKAISKIGDMYNSGGYGLIKNHEKAKECYLEAVKLKDAFAALKIGHMHHGGPENMRNASEALKHYREAISLGINSYAFIISIYKNQVKEYGLEHDLKTLLSCYEKGIAMAQNGHLLLETLGEDHNNASFSDDNYIKAKSWKDLYTRSAFWELYYDLGSLYRTGLPGLEKNYTKAIEYYTEFIPKDKKVEKYFHLTRIYSEGGYGVTKDPEKAMEYFNIFYKLKEKTTAYHVSPEKFISEVADLALNLGNIFANEKNNTNINYAKAIQLYKKGLELTDSDLFCMKIAHLYIEGGYKIEKNYAEAINFFEQAANKGDKNADKNIANLYMTGGYGIKINPDKALIHYKKAFRVHNHIDVLIPIGDIYTNIKLDFISAKIYYENAIRLRLGAKGHYKMAELALKIDRPNAHKEAITHYKKALRAGNKEASMEIANLYTKGGKGIRQDYKEASYYYKKAIRSELKVNEAYYQIAKLTIKIDDDNALEDAIHYYEMAASKPFRSGTRRGLPELLYIDSCINLAELYSKKPTGIDYNYIQALKWYQEAVSKLKILDQGKVYIKMAKIAEKINSSTANKDAADYYEMSFRSGNKEAIIHLGNLYFKGGKGIEQDYEKAREYYIKGAKFNDQHSTYQLGILFENGYGVTKNNEKALKYYQDADKLKHPHALAQIAKMYSNSTIPELKYQESIKYYTIALEKEYTDKSEIFKNIQTQYSNNPQKEHSIALNDYFKNINEQTRRKNLVSISKYYMDADYKNSQGNFYCLLGSIYEDAHYVTNNHNIAFDYYKQAINEGNINALYNLGLSYENETRSSKDYFQAKEYYKQAIKAGHTDALYQLGTLYYNGYIPEDNSNTGITYYYKAAKKGSLSAKYSLAKILYESQKSGNNYKWSKAHPDLEIIENAKKNAINYYEQGEETTGYILTDAHVLIQLGLMYEIGSPKIAKNFEKAEYYYRKAYSRNNNNASYHLGHLYHYRTDQFKDYSEAVNYYNIYKNILEYKSNNNSLTSAYALNTLNKALVFDHLGDIYNEGGYKIERNGHKANNYYSSANEIKKLLFKR